MAAVRLGLEIRSTLLRSKLGSFWQKKILVCIAASLNFLAGAASIVGAVSAAATTMAGTKRACCASGPVGSGRNERRHATSNERDMPWRLAVEDIARGVCRLSMTIRSFSSSVQRRRRPVSSRSTSVLYLWLSISTPLLLRMALPAAFL